MEVLGYAFIALVLTGIFYIFWKILVQGFKAFTDNDD